MRFIASFWILSCLFFIPSASAGQLSWNNTLWHPAEKVQLHPSALDELAVTPAVFVLGEEHYNPSIQNAEAWLLNRLAESRPDSHRLILGWEFLNTIDRERIEADYARYLKGDVSTVEFLQQLFPGGPASTEYAPLIETARLHEADLVPTNLSRAQKSPVTREGMAALDPALLPPDFALGGPLYRERFQEAMGPHPLPYPIDNYFASQSLTDEVMATEILQGDEASTRVLITGSFHSDYRDGVVASLERRVKAMTIVSIRIVDASGMTEEDLFTLMVHPRYGPIADFVFVVNEPLSARKKALPAGKAFR